MLDIRVVVGELCDASTDGICTSTNPNLALMIGTGGAVRAAGGWSIQEACNVLIADEYSRTGKRYFPIGSAHLTNAGTLPFRGVIHCVASDVFHHTSSDAITSCVHHALSIAQREAWSSLAMPLFGTGHVGFEAARAADALAGALTTWSGRVVQRVVIVTRRREHDAVIREALTRHNAS
jgi:O-acetyl-ADP-ribose deacetylase (regulator of RNase III)